MAVEAYYQNGKKNGEFKSWFDNGQLHTIANFENDSLVGYTLSYYKNGNKNYDDFRNKQHKLHGKSNFWFENGVLGQSGQYQDGKSNGEWRRYFPNGQLNDVKNYLNGRLHGPATYFNEIGDTVKTEQYANGTLTFSKDY